MSANHDDVVYSRDGPSHALEFAASLELFDPRQGFGSFERTPIEIEVSLGEQDLTDEDGFGGSIRFRRVVVALVLEDCELARDERYERTLEPEDFTQFLKRMVETSKMAKGGAKAGTSSTLSKVLSAIGLDASAHGEVEASIQSGDVKTIESKIEFKLVRFIAGTRWEVGHETLGDPLNLDGLLRGRYFHLPPDGKKDDGENHLGTVTPVGGRSYATYVELRARKADFIFSRRGAPPSGAPWAVANEEIIERLVCLREFEEQNKRDGYTLPEGEILLARARLTTKRKRRTKTHL